MKIKLQNELVVIDALAILLTIIITLFPSDILRVILGLPYMLFFPGYTLVAALFPARSALDDIERVALSFGFSIAVVTLIGLILNRTPWGVKPPAVAISITLFIIIASIVAWRRRRGQPPAERFVISFSLSLPPWEGQSLIDKILSVFLIVAILGAIGTVSYVLATPRVMERFTEFYVLGLDGKATDYPLELKVGEEGRVIVEITNREQESVRYRLEVRMDNVSKHNTGPIMLAHNQNWREIVSFVPDRAGDKQKVEFLLYKNEESGLYLRLHLWVNVKEPK